RPDESSDAPSVRMTVVGADAAYTLTVTLPASPAAVPPVPAMSGVESAVTRPSAGLVSVTLGTAVSTVQLQVAGVASALPAASIACTWKVCAPAARPLNALGDVQAVKVGLSPPSIAHWNVEPACVEVKPNDAPV